MKLNAKVTIHGDETGVRIEINDDDANTTICEITLTPEEFVSAALGRLASVKCIANVPCPERIGTQHEHKQLEFPLSNQEPNFGDRKEGAARDAIAHCPGGWIPDKYFGSQESFFTRDEKRWARCTIRRYIPKSDSTLTPPSEVS